MVHSNQGITRTQRGEEQPVDAERANTAHQSTSSRSVSREATRDPKLSDDSKTPGSGMTPDDDADAPTG